MGVDDVLGKSVGDKSLGKLFEVITKSRKKHSNVVKNYTFSMSLSCTSVGQICIISKLELSFVAVALIIDKLY